MPVERYEDVIFDFKNPLETPPANGASQNKVDYKFVADNTGEVASFDCDVDFKVEKIADGSAIAVDDHNGILL